MVERKYRTVFLGTSDFAVHSLRVLLEDSRFEVAGVVTQPDRPAGRGQNLLAPPVKQIALEYSIPIFQPISLKSIKVAEGISSQRRPLLVGEKSAEQLVEFLNASSSFDIIITAAYGNIIPLSLIGYGQAPMVNVHPSLLPRWRGAAPLQQAIFAGDKETGVCLMQVEEGLDTGPVFCEERVLMGDDETFGTLHDRLADVGSRLLQTHIESIILGVLKPTVQDEASATYAHKWEKDDALLNWTEPGLVLQRRIRASNPIPGARTFLRAEMLKVFTAELLPSDSYSHALPGTIVGVEEDRLVVACGDGLFLGLLELQVPGRKRLPAKEVLKGYKVNRGDVFTVAQEDS